MPWQSSHGFFTFSHKRVSLLKHVVYLLFSAFFSHCKRRNSLFGYMVHFLFVCLLWTHNAFHNKGHSIGKMHCVRHDFKRGKRRERINE